MWLTMFMAVIVPSAACRMAEEMISWVRDLTLQTGLRNSHAKPIHSSFFIQEHQA
jgi:hypothetical protein